MLPAAASILLKRQRLMFRGFTASQVEHF